MFYFHIMVSLFLYNILYIFYFSLEIFLVLSQEFFFVNIFLSFLYIFVEAIKIGVCF
jgi:hypothetical protein